MVLHDHTHKSKILIFFSYIKAFPVVTMYKGLSYATIPVSAETVSTHHTGVLFMCGLVNSAAGMASGHLWEGQSHHPGCHTQAKQPCLSVGLCTAAAAQGESAGLFKIPPWGAAVEIGQTLHSEASRTSAEHFVTHQSTEPNQSQVSLMQRLAGEFLVSPREWVTKYTGSAQRQIPVVTAITTGQTPISFLYQTCKLNPVTLATVDISGNRNFKGRTEINIWVFCQTQSIKLL